MLDAWKARVRELNVDVYALYLACRDPRVPWYAKALAGCVVAYAFSPIDLIPDPIPVLGYLDDLVLVPAGILLVRRLIPAPALADCRTQARDVMAHGKPVSYVAAAVIIAVWIALTAVVGTWVWRWLQAPSSN
jgi:uncharacterized membrane protein YkvA (DUF1232 family)